MSVSTSQTPALSSSRPPEHPVLPPPVSTPDAAVFAEVRHFHLLGSSQDLGPCPDGLLPALLGAFRHVDFLPADYPLMLASDDSAGPVVTGFQAAILGTLGKNQEARILRDNLRRLHRTVQEALPSTGPADARVFIDAAGQKMQEDLHLSPQAAASLSEDLRSVVQALPEGTKLLGLSPHTPVYLFALSAHRQVRRQRQALLTRVHAAIAQLKGLLDVDRQKDAQARAPDAIQIGMGPVGASLLNPMALSRMLGAHRGGEKMSAPRRARLDEALVQLQAWLTSDDPLAVFLHDGGLDDADASCVTGCRLERVEGPATEVVQRFEAEAQRWMDRFRALRVAELEVDGRWDEAHHGPWMQSFSWPAFAPEELLAMPPVVAVIDAEAAANDALLATSQALASGRPVKVLTHVHPGHDPRAHSTQGYRLELAYFGMSHREAFVHQASAAKPEHMVQGFEVGLGACRAGLFIVSHAEQPAGQPSAVQSWLSASSAVEGRAHPLMWYAPDAGASWKRRLNLSANPEPDEAWPAHTLDCQSTSGAPETLQLRFTFADYALLDRGLSSEFRPIPTDCALHDLLTLDQWLQLDDELAARKVPYIWAEDTTRQLHRIVVTRSMAWLARDRLAYWATLQEFAGVNNEHVETARAEVKREAEQTLQAALSDRDAAHAAELEAARRGAAREVMQRLTSVLLDLDAGPLSASAPAPLSHRATPAAPAPAVAEPEAKVEAPAPPPPEPEVEEDTEAWVDSPLCTSCNDCVILNPRLFVYDGNKQVRIGDPTAGTYAQLVKAAEGCPSKCIHPGAPLDKTEPGLEALMQRAKRFN